MNKIEELIEEIYLLEENTLTAEEYKAKLRTLLTTYTCEVAKIDEQVYKDADKIVYKGCAGAGTLTDKQETQIVEYNRLIAEKYQAQPETPEPEQPSPNWWESLKEGDLVVNHHGDINVVRNWYQEAIGERRVFVEFFEGITTSEHLLRPYTPTPTEAIADLQAGKINAEQFKKVYKP